MFKINYLFERISKPHNLDRILNSNVNTSAKDLLKRFARNPEVKTLLERTPKADILTICEAYKKSPTVYDDAFNGKIKFFLEGLQDKALPVFNNEKKNTNLKKILLSPNSLVDQTVKLFGNYEDMSIKTKRIYLTMLNKDEIKFLLVDSKDKTVLEFTRQTDKVNEVFLRMIKASDNKSLELIRD